MSSGQNSEEDSTKVYRECLYLSTYLSYLYLFFVYTYQANTSLPLLDDSHGSASPGLEWHIPGPAAYNAGMGALAAIEIDAWLREGGWWLRPASAPPALLPPPSIAPARPRDSPPGPRPTSWTGRALSARPGSNAACDGRLLLNPTQEQALWAAIAGCRTAPGHTARRPAPSLGRSGHGGPRIALLPMRRSCCEQGPRRLAAGCSRLQRLADGLRRNLPRWQPAEPRRLPLELIPLLKCASPRRSAPPAAAWPALTAFCPCSAPLRRLGRMAGGCSRANLPAQVLLSQGFRLPRPS